MPLPVVPPAKKSLTPNVENTAYPADRSITRRVSGAISYSVASASCVISRTCCRA
jgi:hypothetical protein